MGYWFTAELPDGAVGQAAKVGIYGSQDVMLGLWLAAYGVAGLPDSRRVRGRWYSPFPGAPDWAFYEGEMLAGARRLLAHNQDGVAWVIVTDRTDRTITRGLQLKPPRCPHLRNLTDLWRVYNRFQEPGARLAPDLVARLAGTFTLLLPQLTVSCWHAKLAEIAAVFDAATAAGVGVRHG
jgi:hypothetical protein